MALIWIIECKHVIRECFKAHYYRPSMDEIQEMISYWKAEDFDIEYDSTFDDTM